MYRALKEGTGRLVAIKVFDCARRGIEELETELNTYAVVGAAGGVESRYVVDEPSGVVIVLTGFAGCLQQ